MSIVLIADDNLIVRRSLTSALNKREIKTDIAECGHIALQTLQTMHEHNIRVPVAILDQHMKDPDCTVCYDGDGVVKEWKKRHPDSKTVFVCYTSDNKGRKEFNDTFVKPSMQEMISYVADIYIRDSF